MTTRSPSADHVFVCCARKDQDFVLKLARNLKARGALVWIDQWDIPPTVDWDLTIDNALYDCVQFLIVLSPAAIASREVRGELRTALDEDKPIVPVLYQECRVPRHLRQIQHLDFTARDPDDEAALAEVLRASGVPEAPPPELSQPEPFQVSPPGKTRVTPDRQPFEPEMVLIPAGEFLMGSDPQKDKDADGDEQPQHSLYLPDYYLAKTPVTNAQYVAFVEGTGQDTPKHWEGGKPPGGKGDHPVVYVSWHDAVAYCRWLAETTGKPYRLPSEAEWEKGARGTDGRIYPWGDRWNAKLCNSKEGGPGDTTPVGAYPDGTSPYGVLDMAGNVWEWTLSLWGKGFMSAFGAGFKYLYNPNDGREDLESKGPRVLRGGAFNNNQRNVRCACRNRNNPNNTRKRGTTGFAWFWLTTFCPCRKCQAATASWPRRSPMGKRKPARSVPGRAPRPHPHPLFQVWERGEGRGSGPGE
jgi:formylglycine-generating enzyme required for sulfatase activity